MSTLHAVILITLVVAVIGFFPALDFLRT